MTELQAALARIERLEMTVADQDRTLEELNGVVVDQWKRIEELTRRVALVVDQLREVESGAAGRGLPEPPPPHY